MHDNTNSRDAKRILHGLHNILRCTSGHATYPQ
jgi:hypothetical protein